MYFKLFFTFLKIGLFTIGGGYAMIPLIEREVVDKKWLDRDDFYDLFTITQTLPGVFAVNIAIFVGFKLKKFRGALACAMGTILPSFCIILLIAIFFTQTQDNIYVQKAFKGLRPAVVALIIVPCISAAKASKLTSKTIVIPIIATLLIWQFDVSPIYIILGAAIGAIIYSFKLKK